jgi:hypothetical protein
MNEQKKLSTKYIINIYGFQRIKNLQRREEKERERGLKDKKPINLY